MPALAAALPWISAGVGALSALSQADAQKRAADASKVQADATAARLRQQAGQEQAVSQNKAQGTILENRLVSSRAQSLLAASGADAGGGPATAGVDKLLGDLAAEGEYRVQADLYGGRSRAATLEQQARDAEYTGNVAGYEGKLAKQAGYTNAVASFANSIGKSDTALDQVSTFYDKYKTRNLAPVKQTANWGGY